MNTTASHSVAKAARAYHLLIEDADAARADDALVGSLEVPESGVSALDDSGDTPRLAPLGSKELHGEQLAFSVARFDGRSLLVVVRGRCSRALVNGDVPPAIDVLELGDEIELDARWRLHVSLHLRPFVGRPREVDVGRECPVCRASIDRAGDDDVVIYACPHCDGIVHSRASLEGEPEPLECIRLSSTCPTCGNPILARDEERFAYVPAL